MNPEPQPIKITGMKLMDVRTAQTGIILTLEEPSPSPAIVFETLYLCITTGLNLHIQPGIDPARALEIAKQNAQPELILRTHCGPLPAELEALAKPFGDFSAVIGLPITDTIPTPDGSQGFVMDFNNGYMVQIDLYGIQLLRYENGQHCPVVLN